MSHHFDESKDIFTYPYCLNTNKNAFNIMQQGCQHIALKHINVEEQMH